MAEEISEISKVMVPHGQALETAKLVALLKDGKVGDTLSDKVMSEACRRNTATRGDGYNNLRAAIRYVCKTHGITWERVRKQGLIECLNAGEIVTSADSSASRIRREAVRAGQKLRTIDLNAVEDKERPAILSRMAQHGTLAQFAKAATRKAFEEKNQSTTIDPHKLLEALK